MKAVVLFACLFAGVAAQFDTFRPSAAPQPVHALPPRRTVLKEANHLRDITQPHLPQDPNVLAATAQFLNKFAELKALADAAPDPIPRHRPAAHHRFAAPAPQAGHVQQFAPAQRQQFAPAQRQQFAPAQRQQFAPVQQFAPRPQAPHTQPTHSNFNTQRHTSGLGHQASAPRFAPQPARAPARAPTPRPRPRVFDPSIPVTNQAGHIINPLQFPGPLADQFPASVKGSSQFTPAVQAAQVALADAHASILEQQATARRANPTFDQQQNHFF